MSSDFSITIYGMIHKTTYLIGLWYIILFHKVLRPISQELLDAHNQQLVKIEFHIILILMIQVTILHRTYQISCHNMYIIVTWSHQHFYVRKRKYLKKFD